jgi:CRP-like cAMP-binding protein
VKSIAQCTLLFLDKNNYAKLRDEGNPVARAIEDQTLNSLTARLRDANKRIGRLAEGSKARYVTPDPGILRRVGKLFGGGGGRGWAFGVDQKAVLQRSPLFGDLPAAGLQELTDRMGAASFATGHFLCTQGEYGKEMFVLAEGLVEVLVTLEGDDRVEPLAQLDPGDAFGMVSLVEDLPRTASCVARGKAIALSLDRDAFKQIISSSTIGGSALRTAIIRALTDQIAFANSQLALLDIEKKAKTGEHLTPLLKVGMGMEAHGKHLQESKG